MLPETLVQTATLYRHALNGPGSDGLRFAVGDLVWVAGYGRRAFTARVRALPDETPGQIAVEWTRRMGDEPKYDLPLVKNVFDFFDGHVVLISKSKGVAAQVYRYMYNGVGWSERRDAMELYLTGIDRITLGLTWDDLQSHIKSRLSRFAPPLVGSAKAVFDAAVRGANGEAIGFPELTGDIRSVARACKRNAGLVEEPTEKQVVAADEAEIAGGALGVDACRRQTTEV